MAMRKKLNCAVAAVLVSSALSVTAFAGTWRSDSKGWWYQRDDGSYPAGTWEWIDSTGSGTAECYYFYPDGYMAYNNDIDGYHLNNSGQWEIGGKVQYKSQAAAAFSGSAQTSMAAAAVTAYRKALKDNTWNSRGIKAEDFALVDVNNDGVLEMVATTYAGYFDLVDSFLYYDGSDLKIYELGGVEGVAYVDPSRSMFYTGRISGKDICGVYAFDPANGVSYIDGWFLGYGDAENAAKYQKYGTGMKMLHSVGATDANIELYLSGAGQATGFENWKPEQ